MDAHEKDDGAFQAGGGVERADAHLVLGDSLAGVHGRSRSKRPVQARNDRPDCFPAGVDEQHVAPGDVVLRQRANLVDDARQLVLGAGEGDDDRHDAVRHAPDVGRNELLFILRQPRAVEQRSEVENLARRAIAFG